MRIFSVIAAIFLYLVIFSQQTIGLNVIEKDCGNSNPRCHIISDETANWHTAQDICVQQEGTLIEYIYGWINAFIQANNGGDDFWSGWRRVGNSSVFQWTNGNTFSSSDQTEWKDNHPIDGIECVGIDGKIKLLSFECNTNHTGFCDINNDRCNELALEYALQQEYVDICSSSLFSSGIPTESSLRNLTLNFNVTTDDIIEFSSNPLVVEIVITKLRANSQITIPIYYYTVQIETDPFQEDTTIVIHTSVVQFDNASLVLRTRQITIYTNSNSTGNLKILYANINYRNLLCVLKRSDGNWSAEGVTTNRTERNVLCTTYIHGLTTVAVAEITETDPTTINSENTTTVTTTIVSPTTNDTIAISENTTTVTTTIVSPTTNNTIAISENNTVNCSSSNTNQGILCTSFEFVTEPENETSNGVSLLLQREVILQSILLKVNVSTGIILLFYISQDIVVIITRVSADINTNIPIEGNSIEIATDSFSTETTLVILVDTNPPKTTVKLISDVISLFASNELIGELTIVFQLENIAKFEDEDIECVFLTNNTVEEWSTEGINTVIGFNGSIECTTNHLTTFAVLFSSAKQCGRDQDNIWILTLTITSYTLLGISLLFLFSSVAIFILSGKKFFSVDINILHFNHALSLLLAVGIFIFLVQSASSVHWLCTAVAFLLHFLWTNVFLSSLSIGILVFYSIWVVSVKRPSKKLYKYLVPISWCLSLLWSLAWFGYGKLTNQYLDVDTHDDSSDKDCEYSCFLNKEQNLQLSFLVPVYVILFLNTILLSLCLCKIRIALKKKHRFENELSRLRRVSMGAILLMPALSLPFIISIPLFLSIENVTLHLAFEWAYILSNAPIGFIHFLLITVQIPEARIPKLFRPKSQQPATSITEVSTARQAITRVPSLKLNIVRLKGRNNEDTTVYGNDCVETGCK